MYLSPGSSDAATCRIATSTGSESVSSSAKCGTGSRSLARSTSVVLSPWTRARRNAASGLRARRMGRRAQLTGYGRGQAVRSNEIAGPGQAIQGEEHVRQRRPPRHPSPDVVVIQPAGLHLGLGKSDFTEPVKHIDPGVHPVHDTSPRNQTAAYLAPVLRTGREPWGKTSEGPAVSLR
eukprot:scaffold496_cov236-Pinguiococcus_pyrenoidosus.AAC.4